MRRQRNAKIVATLGPASSTPDRIRELFLAGADVFRLNFSHGSHDDHRARVQAIRDLESETGRPVGILLDLQGPKLRLGPMTADVELRKGAAWRLDLALSPGDHTRAPLPHPEIFSVLQPGAQLLVDDGRVRLEVSACDERSADVVVRVGGTVSSRKGVNVPGLTLPISAMTAKDRTDLAFGLELGVDWVALSFVQRPEDIHELRALMEGSAAGIVAKLEKPAALVHLDALAEASDAIMVARGDLGVELPPEQVPGWQKRIVHTCRRHGRPVIVATHMLDSMVRSPVPTRAEASDVANAVYDGADAVMLSAESAAGDFPVESVMIMDRIITEVERDPHYRRVMDAEHPAPGRTVPDAVCCAMRRTTQILGAAATVTYTASGASALRAARERPESPILGLCPRRETARRLCLVWGVHPVAGEDIRDVAEMVEHARDAVRREGFAGPGDSVVIVAGMPFGHSGSTNLLHVTTLE